MTRRHRRMRKWLDDEQLEDAIAEALEEDPGLLGALILIDVERGYATLAGIVRTDMNRRRAGLLARALGALGVNNQLRLESDIRQRTI